MFDRLIKLNNADPELRRMLNMYLFLLAHVSTAPDAPVPTGPSCKHKLNIEQLKSCIACVPSLSLSLSSWL